MSQLPSNLEAEAEEYSPAAESPISVASESDETRDMKSADSSAIKPTSEPQIVKTSDSAKASSSDLAAPIPTRSALKSQSATKPSRPKSSSSPTKTKQGISILQSRRMRIVAMAACVLFVGGLIVLNWKGGSSKSSGDVADSDLSEFNDLSEIDVPQIDSASEPRRLGILSDAESISATERFPQRDSNSRSSTLGLVTHADHLAPRGQVRGDIIPVSSSSNDSQGAVLTGKIEFETPSRPTEVSARPFRNPGTR